LQRRGDQIAAMRVYVRQRVTLEPRSRLHTAGCRAQHLSLTCRELVSALSLVDERDHQRSVRRDGESANAAAGDSTGGSDFDFPVARRSGKRRALPAGFENEQEKDSKHAPQILHWVEFLDASRARLYTRITTRMSIDPTFQQHLFNRRTI